MALQAKSLAARRLRLSIRSILLLKTEFYTVKLYTFFAAIALCLTMVSHSIAQEAGDETADYLVETVLTGLDDPFGLAVRSGKSKDGFSDLYIAESGALRVVDRKSVV